MRGIAQLKEQFMQFGALRSTGWTPWPNKRCGFRMARRHVFDSLEPTKEPCWYEVRNMHRGLLEARLLPAGTDLKRSFVAAMLEWIDAGWKLGEFSSRIGTFFCTRDADRRMLGSTPNDPGRVGKI
jgi:hypothetical protein